MQYSVSNRRALGVRQILNIQVKHTGICRRVCTKPGVVQRENLQVEVLMSDGGHTVPASTDPMAAVRRYVEALNEGDAEAMAGVCADPMQILDVMSPHVWQGPTANDDWWNDVLAAGERFKVSDLHITLDEPRHVRVTGDYAYVVVPATLTFDLGGRAVTQTDSLFTVALRKVDVDWRLSAWAWARGS